MARTKITTNSVACFMAGKDFEQSNTKAFKHPGTGKFVLSLFGNIIAERDLKTGKITITNCGWFSITTKERLNEIPGVHIYQKKGIWYLNGKEWNGNKTAIN